MHIRQGSRKQWEFPDKKNSEFARGESAAEFLDFAKVINELTRNSMLRDME